MNEKMIMSNKVKTFMSLLSGIIIALAVIFFGSGNAWAADVSDQTGLEAALGGTDSVITLTGNITLTKDITVSRAVTLSGGPITLDTAGYSLIVASGGNLTVDGDLTITGSGEQTIKVQNAGIFTLDSGNVLSASGSTWHSAIYIDGGGTVNINGGTVVSEDGHSEGALYADGGIVTVNVSGGEITGYSHGIKLFHIDSTSSRSTVTVGGGTITATAPETAAQAYGVRVEKGDVTIGGDAEISALFPIAVNVGSLDISGGTIDGSLSLDTCPTVIGGGTVNGDISIVNSSTVTFTGGTVNGQTDLYNCGTVEISGGTFTSSGPAVSISSSGDVTISGGTFSGSVGVNISSIDSGKSVSISGDADITGTDYGVYGSSGTITISGQDVAISGGYGLYAANGGTFTVSGGTITGSSYGSIFINGGALTLTGGTIINSRNEAGYYGIYIQTGPADNRITTAEDLAINADAPLFYKVSSCFNSVPGLQTMAVGETKAVTLQGFDTSTFEYTIDATNTSAELNAGKTSATIFSMAPTAAGSYNLVLSGRKSGETAFLTLTVPVSVVYSLTYDANGGTGAAPAKIYLDKDETFTTAAADGFTPPSGKQFKEWNTVINGSGTTYSANATVTMPANNLMLYAIWEDIPVTYTAGISPTSKIFTAAMAGYSQQAAQEFTITNTGTGTITGLSAALASGTNFEISTALSASSLNAGGTATVSVRPKTGLAANTYTDTLTITGSNGISLTCSLSFTVNPEATYGISLDKTGTYTFAGQTAGYVSVTPLTITVSNTGNQATGDLTVVLSGTNPGSYALSKTTVDSIAASGSDTFTVATNTGLSVGTYTATVTVSGGSNITEQAFTVSFTVDPTPVVSATISPDFGSFDKYVPADVQTTITWGSATGVTDVKAGGSSIGAADYSVSANTLTIKKEYLAAQATGCLVLTAEFNAGASATLSVTISDTTPPTINYASRNYDLSAPANVSVIIAWNSASSVTDVVYSVSPDTTLYMLDMGDYTVVGNDLTIKNSFFSGLSLTTGAALDFDINFNTGATVALAVNVVDSYTPGSNADLSSLSVNGTPVSGFDPDILAYYVVQPYGASSVIVTATASDSNAQISITQAPSLPGSATVTVTAKDGTTKTYTINFTIGAAPAVTVTNITVTGTSGISSIQVGSTLQMLADVSPANATDRSVTWSIGAGSGATINASGLLTATAEGPVTVRATANDSSSVYGEMTVTVNAAPVTTYTVTFSSNGSVYTTKTVNAGQSIGSAAWPTDPTRTSYTFGGWFTGENGAGAQFTSATPVNVTTTVYAKWTYSSGGGSGGSSGGSGNSPTIPATPTYKADVVAENGAESTLLVTVDKNSRTASVDAGSQSFDKDGMVITIPSIPDVDTYSVGISVPDLSTAGKEGALTFSTGAGSITIPSNMLSGVSGISGGKAEITISKGDKEHLPDDIKTAIGDKPLIQLTLSIDGTQTDWSNPDAPVTVSIPYTPTAAELADPESIVVWYIDGSGNVITIPNGRYDPVTGMVTFNTTHFSNYAVAYSKMSFNDVASSAWYYKSVSFIAAREITTGTSNGNFSPEAELTRGEFIVLMMRAYDIPPDTNPTDNFYDAGNTYYTGYLTAAKRLGISSGIGNNQYAPDKDINRQEMFTMLYNALKVAGKLPGGDSGKTLSDFTDAGQIDAWAKEAMTLMVKTGNVGGSNEKLTPQDTTTRAEMAQVLYNLLGK